MTQTVTVKMYKDSGYYFVDASETDQGVAGDGLSVKDIVDAIGATKKATMVFGHTGTGNTTEYQFSTNETITSNFNVLVEIGARILVATGITITCQGAFNPPPLQVIELTGTGAFNVSNTKPVHHEWLGGVGSSLLLGTKLSKSLDTSYTAETDGAVYAYGIATTDDDWFTLRGETPTATAVTYCSGHYDVTSPYNYSNANSIAFFVPRGATWQVSLTTEEGTITTQVWWQPFLS